MMFNIARTKNSPKKELSIVPMESLLGRVDREYLDFLIFPLPKSSLFGRSFAVFECVTQNTKKISTKSVWASATRNTHDQTAFFKVADRHTRRISTIAVTLYVSQAKMRQGMTTYGKGGGENQDNRVIPGSLAKLIQTGGMKGWNCGQEKYHEMVR